MANLTEAYAKRIKLAESLYSRANNGARMDNNRKIVLAQCLKNTESFLNEAFSNAAGTQRSDMGMYKKFCVNLTNIAVPQLIAPELVMTKPMASMSGYVTYIEYQSGTTKGQTAAGTAYNSMLGLSAPDSTYTSSRVVESVSSFTSGTTKVAWTPVAKDENGAPVIKFLDADGNALTATGVSVAADGTVTATVTGTVAKIAYAYDNEIIPANDIPTLKAEMKSIALVAKARRIAVYYSQLAAFQA